MDILSSKLVRAAKTRAQTICGLNPNRLEHIIGSGADVGYLLYLKVIPLKEP